jgi:hypothetical protein
MGQIYQFHCALGPPAVHVHGGGPIGVEVHTVGRLIVDRHEYVLWLNAPCRLDELSGEQSEQKIGRIHETDQQSKRDHNYRK